MVGMVFDHVNGKTEMTYPCRCGQTHRGEYAAEDYAHHNCFHQAPLVRIEETGDVVCPQCGNSWRVT